MRQSSVPLTPPPMEAAVPYNQRPSAPHRPLGITVNVVMVPDLVEAERWYTLVLGCEVVQRYGWGGDTAHHVQPASDVRFGRNVIRLALQEPPPRPRMNHQAFNCRDMQELDYWYAHLSEYNVGVSTVTGHHGMGFISIYFDDPWGNPLEIGTDVMTWEKAQQLVDERQGGYIGIGMGGAARPGHKTPTVSQLEAERRGTAAPA